MTKYIWQVKIKQISEFLLHTQSGISPIFRDNNDIGGINGDVKNAPVDLPERDIWVK